MVVWPPPENAAPTAPCHTIPVPGTLCGPAPAMCLWHLQLLQACFNFCSRCHKFCIWRMGYVIKTSVKIWLKGSVTHEIKYLWEHQAQDLFWWHSPPLTTLMFFSGSIRLPFLYLLIEHLWPWLPFRGRNLAENSLTYCRVLICSLKMIFMMHWGRGRREHMQACNQWVGHNI